MARASDRDLAYRLSVETDAQDTHQEPGGSERIRVEEVGPQLLRAHFFDQRWNIELTFVGADRGSEGTGTLFVLLLGLVATGLALALTRRVTQERLHLEAALVERTAELERTRYAIADAHRIDALGRLTGGVAHDFNNLLGVIAGNLDLLRDTLPPDVAEDAHDLVEDATQATERGARLTQKLLTLSRQAALRPEVLDLDDVVREMTAVLRRTLPATLEVSHRLAGDLPRVRVDRVQLESALLNLAINARDAMPDGGRLTLSTRRLDEEGAWAELCVTDTGTGMTPDVARRALDPFFTTKEVGKGTGLGLAIVAGFVGQSGGEVKVDSVEQRGTSIRLRFPATDAAAGDPVDDDQEWTPVARSGEVIAVIEDNAELRLVLDRQLHALGYEVLNAEDGRGGLEAIARAPRVDLVLSDCVLPGDVDGYGVARALAETRPALPVVLMSGYADPPEPDPDAPGPPPIRLTKPIRRADLARELRARIDGRTEDPAR
jgi:signal transduction histidine kinase